MLDEFCEVFRSSIPYTVVIIIPILIVIAPGTPVLAAHDFTVYRLQQYDLQGSTYGSRSSAVNVESRSLDSKSLLRKCALTNLPDFSADKLQTAVTQGAAGLIVIIPSAIPELSKEERELLMEIEQTLVSDETYLPIYFVVSTPELSAIYQEVVRMSDMEEGATGAQVLLSAVAASGFQMIIDIPSPTPQMEFDVLNIQGELTGLGMREHLPTIAIVAHYDAFGGAPAISFGADSNASGVAMLLELVRLFSKLFRGQKSHPKFNIQFLLSGAGKFNYQGSKRWIDDQLDASALDSSLLSNSLYTLCLDSVGQGSDLHLHVSKPPKEGSAGNMLVQNLETISSRLNVNFSIVHKKINLAGETLAWEHERFSIRRLPAFTLSHYNNHLDLGRKSITDTYDKVDIKTLARNTQIIAQALSMHIFNLTYDEQQEVFTNDLVVETPMLDMWMELLLQQSRAAQLVTRESDFVRSIQIFFKKYLHDPHTLSFKADKRDPEFIFYNAFEGQLHSYSVKPAVFDLFLACLIAGYLGLIFLVIQKFDVILYFLKKFGATKLEITQNGYTKHKVH